MELRNNNISETVDVTEGSVLLAGKDIRELDIATLHKQFAIVFQETVLLHDTIANNIRVGNPSALMIDIINAA
jgi:ABC-type multidrug transport system fused ATPase/permease subunit